MNTTQTVTMTAVPSQVPGGYVLSAAPPETRTSPKARPCFKLRLATAITQTFLGVITAICGIVVLSLKYPSRFESRLSANDSLGTAVEQRSDQGDALDRVDTQAWAIWMGAVMVITSLFGYFSKRSQSLISVYMAFSIIGTLVAFMGIIVALQYVVRTDDFRKELQRLLTTDIRFYYAPCWFDSYTRQPTENPLLREMYNRCIESHIGAARAHLPFYVIMLICFLVEFATTILAASSSCPGLKCCCPTDDEQGLVYLQQVGPQGLSQRYVQGPQGYVHPQVNPQQMVPSDPPPAYTSLIHEPTSTRPTNGTATTAVGPNQPALSVPPSGASGASLQTGVTDRRIPTSALPKTPAEQQAETAYLEPSNEGPRQSDPSYLTPNNGEPPQSDSSYLTPNVDPYYVTPTAGGPPQSDSSYLTPNADPSYVTPNTGGPPQSDSSYLTPNSDRSPQCDSSYLTPNTGGPVRTDTAYLEPNATRQVQGNQNEVYPYDYADPREDERVQTRRATNGGANNEYMTVIP